MEDEHGGYRNKKVLGTELVWAKCVSISDISLIRWLQQRHLKKACVHSFLLVFAVEAPGKECKYVQKTALLEGPDPCIQLLFEAKWLCITPTGGRLFSSGQLAGKAV